MAPFFRIIGITDPLLLTSVVRVFCAKGVRDTRTATPVSLCV